MYRIGLTKLKGTSSWFQSTQWIENSDMPSSMRAHTHQAKLSLLVRQIRNSLLHLPSAVFKIELLTLLAKC